MDARLRVTMAWLSLLAAGLALPLVGELTWTIAGREVFGEYVVSFVALGGAGGALWAFGLRSDGEWLAARATVLLALLTPAAVLLDNGWRWPAEAAMHLALCVQLAMWFREAARLRGSEVWPVGVMLAGMLAEVGNLAWKMSSDLPADCDTMMWLSCVVGPWAALALPIAITLAIAPWLCGWSPIAIMLAAASWLGGWVLSWVRRS
jgi:hypothetical protein